MTPAVNARPSSPPANRGLVTATREYNGSTWQTTDSYTYDSFGNQLTDTDADGHPTTTSYDPAGLFPVKTCNALSQCSTSTGWDRAAEAPAQLTAITGGQTTTQYDPSAGPSARPGPPASPPRPATPCHRDGTTTIDHRNGRLAQPLGPATPTG